MPATHAHQSAITTTPRASCCLTSMLAATCGEISRLAVSECHHCAGEENRDNPNAACGSTGNYLQLINNRQSASNPSVPADKMAQNGPPLKACFRIVDR